MWEQQLERERSRYQDGEARVGGLADPDDRQRQLTRMGNAAAGAGLCALMLAAGDEASAWFDRAAQRYRESFADAPPGSWGRPIGALKARLLAGDRGGAQADARWALEAGARESDSPIGRYAACLAELVLGRNLEARVLADSLRARDDFPQNVADALAAIAGGDPILYAESVESVLRSFETREEYLEDVPVADTVLVLQALAVERGFAVELDSPLLPG